MKYLDSLDFKFDHFTVIPKNEWRVLAVGKAKKPIDFTRFCRPNCEYFKKDLDGFPICIYGCQYYIFERHIINTGESIVNLLFAVNDKNPHEGISIWIGEKYLRLFLGDLEVNKMLKDYSELISNTEYDLSSTSEEEDNEN